MIDNYKYVHALHALLVQKGPAIFGRKQIPKQL